MWNDQIHILNDRFGVPAKNPYFEKQVWGACDERSLIQIIDLGPKNESSVDYPDFARKVARNVVTKKSNIGILVCGSGTGMAMSANKFKKIRAAVCYNKASTSLSRKHNNANIIALGSRLTKKSVALKLVNIFLSTKFEGGRHLKRIKKV